MRCFIVCSCLLSAALAWSGGMGAAVSAPSVIDLSTSEPLGALNEVLLDQYTRLRDETLAHSGPLIYAAGDDMVLIRGDQRSSAHTATRRYHELKAVAHAPLSIYVMLAADLDSPLPKERLESLKAYRVLLAKAKVALASNSFNDVQRERQEKILGRSLKFLDKAIKTERVLKGDLKSFASSQRTDIEANVRDAAADQIDAMDRQVDVWLSSMTAQERSRLRVIVGGSHMPRVGNIAFQYFLAKLGEPYGGRWSVEKNGSGRVVFGESMWDEKKALNLLATHQVDAGIGEYFFGDPERMHRDLLADAAESVIAEKFGKKPEH